MEMVPRKRLLTRESIPLGLRQLGSTHMKRSLWWRKKRLVPASGQPQSSYTFNNPPVVGRPSQSSKAFRLVMSSTREGQSLNVRFFTIGTCFLAETIWKTMSALQSLDELL